MPQPQGARNATDVITTREVVPERSNKEIAGDLLTNVSFLRFGGVGSQNQVKGGVSGR